MEIVAALPPMHPGGMLREEFLKPLGLSPYRVELEAIETCKQAAE
jgi:plasmid maintenance system antidote protein VapI